MAKPYSEACERNKQPILDVLRQELAGCARVLEIGSGTGQHAVYFARQLPQLVWQTSDVADHHPGIRAWVDEVRLPNCLYPLTLDVVCDPWPETAFDAVFSANTAHIMHWQAVMAMFAGTARVLSPRGIFCLYGPFSYRGEHTSQSNARFDRSLRLRDPASGIRDVDDLVALATGYELDLVADHEMPANNRLLIWRRAGDRGREPGSRV